MNTSNLGNQVSKATIATPGTMVTGKSMVVSNHGNYGTKATTATIQTLTTMVILITKLIINIHSSSCRSADFNQNGIFLADFSKNPSMKFHNNMSSVSHAVPCGWIKRQRQMHGPDKANTCSSQFCKFI